MSVSYFFQSGPAAAGTAGSGFGGFQQEAIGAWPFTSAHAGPLSGVLGIVVAGVLNLPGVDFALTLSGGYPVCTPYGTAPNPTIYGCFLLTALTGTAGSTPGTPGVTAAAYVLTSPAHFQS